MDKEISLPKLASSASLKTSLEAIRKGDAGLNEKRKSLLNRVPDSNDWAAVEKDILFHGVERHCNFDDELLELLKRGVYKLVAHTHPDYGKIVVSEDDRRFLRYIN